MKKKHVLFFSAFLLLMFAQFSTLHAQIKWTTFDKMSSKKMTAVFITASKEISSPSNPEVPSTNSNSGVRSTNEWCRWAARMEQVTFKDKKVVKYGNKKFNFAQLDAVETKTITFNGKTYKHDSNDGANGRHELSKFLMGESITVPMTVILDKKQEVLRTISGFLSAKDLDAILKYYGEGTYKKQDWDSFVKENKIVLQN